MKRFYTSIELDNVITNEEYNHLENKNLDSSYIKFDVDLSVGDISTMVKLDDCLSESFEKAFNIKHFSMYQLKVDLENKIFAIPINHSSWLNVCWNFIDNNKDIFERKLKITKLELI